MFLNYVSLAHHFPESCLLIIVGLITGVIVHFAYEIDDKVFFSFKKNKYRYFCASPSVANFPSNLFFSGQRHLLPLLHQRPLLQHPPAAHHPGICRAKKNFPQKI